MTELADEAALPLAMIARTASEAGIDLLMLLAPRHAKTASG